MINDKCQCFKSSISSIIIDSYWQKIFCMNYEAACYVRNIVEGHNIIGFNNFIVFFQPVYENNRKSLFTIAIIWIAIFIDTKRDCKQEKEYTYSSFMINIFGKNFFMLHYSIHINNNEVVSMLCFILWSTNHRAIFALFCIDCGFNRMKEYR